MDNDETITAAVSRRRLLRAGGLAMVGAAAVTLRPTSAAAAPGDPLVIGTSNDGGSAATRLAVDGDAPTLALANPTGAQLLLEPSDASAWAPETGEVKNTVAGPLIGLDPDGAGVQQGYLVTNVELQDLVTYMPMIYTPPPTRVLDTRYADGRVAIVNQSPGAFDADGRLVGGGWMDVAVDAASGDLDVSSVFANLTVTLADAGGFLRLFAYGDEAPNTSSLNFTSGQNIANFAVTAVGERDGRPTVRIDTTTTTHVLLDVTAVYGAFPIVTPGIGARAQQSTEQSAATLARSLRAPATLPDLRSVRRD